MVLGYFGSFMPHSPSALEVLLASIWFSLFNFPCISLWAYVGERLQIYMSDLKYRRMFNASMALLLVASMLPMVLQGRGVA
jgi:threonine/homoserine/homoserine lactone efflux protein